MKQIHPGDPNWENYDTRVAFDFPKREGTITFRLDQLFPKGCTQDEAKWLSQHPEVIAKLMFILATDLSMEAAEEFAQGYLDAKLSEKLDQCGIGLPQ
jgi:hypothetical protein